MSDFAVPTVPEPIWIIRGNRVQCAYCGLKLKTTQKYISHFLRRHMNDDGTWRPAEHKFAAIADPSPEELEALEAADLGVEGRNSYGRKHKPRDNWWEL